MGEEEKNNINQSNKQFLDALNRIDETFKAYKEGFQKQLAKTQKLLDTVIDGTNSAIIGRDSRKGVFLKNRRAKELIEELGEENISRIISEVSSPGVYNYEDEKSRRYFSLSVSLFQSEDGEGFVYIMDDVTHIKNLENENQRNERMRLMGEMAANIAHEVRNPLGSIELYASLLQRDVEKDPEKKRLTGSIIKGVRTINAVISNTLLFAKDIKINPKEYILADIVDEVVLYLQHIIRDKKVKFINRLNEDHVVLCDADMYKQVVMNIIGNSVDAVKEGGIIEADSEMNEETTVLSLKDNGSGIDKDMLSRLFMPFQTTKAKGTGLGLSIAYKIIKAHGGDIAAESNGENYTKFTVTLPRHKKANGENI